jgi:hypothetical protein
MMECAGHLSELYKMNDCLQSWFHEESKEFQTTSEKNLAILVEHKIQSFELFLDKHKDEIQPNNQLDDYLRKIMHKSYAKGPCQSMLKTLLQEGRLLKAWNVQTLVQTREFDAD